jgi:chemotaxis protein methyltransferase CheR
MSLGDDEVSFIRDLVRRHAAIVLEADKGYLIEARLAGLCRAMAIATPGELIARLRAQPGSELRQRVVDAMTINETSFFRDVHPFASLRTTVLPALLAARAQARQLTIWSAASSSGQEPYSVAMLLLEHFPQLAHWSVRIIATDVSHEMIERARRGRYSQFEVNRGLPVPMQLRYFTRHGAEYEICPQVRRMVELREVNLAGPLPPLPPLDVVLLRNVLIYFDAPTRQRVLTHVHRLMQPDGWLCVGSGESAADDDRFRKQPLGPTTWLRPALAEGTLPPGATARLALPPRGTDKK